MKQYLKLANKLLKEGVKKEPARENMPYTLSLFGEQVKYNLQEGFPLLTTKKVSFKNIVIELLWFLRGDSNIKFMTDNGCNIWVEDSYQYYLKACDMDNLKEKRMPLSVFTDNIGLTKIHDDVGEKNYAMPSYYTIGDTGNQYPILWRNYADETDIIDQFKNLIGGLRKNPFSRRHIITAWNPLTLDYMALPACHSFVQFNVREKDGERFLDCQLYQRSGDFFLGVGYNIASYALLTHIVALLCEYKVGTFVHTLGDVHLYSNHLEQMKEQLKREPRELPELSINRDLVTKIGEDFDFNVLGKDWKDYFILKNYNHHSAIKAPLSTGLN